MPEVAAFSPDADSVRVGETVTFRWSAGDTDGLLAGYLVDFGDGTSTRGDFAQRCVDDPSDPVAERPSFEHAYSSAGTYTVTLTVFSSGSCGAGDVQSVASTASVQAVSTLLGGVPSVVSGTTTTAVLRTV